MNVDIAARFLISYVRIEAFVSNANTPGPANSSLRKIQGAWCLGPVLPEKTKPTKNHLPSTVRTGANVLRIIQGFVAPHPTPEVGSVK